MPSVLDDPGLSSPWARLYRELKQRRDSLIESIVSGALDYPGYQHHCGRHSELNAIIAHMESVIRGDDARMRAPREPLPSPD